MTDDVASSISYLDVFAVSNDASLVVSTYISFVRVITLKLSFRSRFGTTVPKDVHFIRVSVSQV